MIVLVNDVFHVLHMSMVLFFCFIACIAFHREVKAKIKKEEEIELKMRKAKAAVERKAAAESETQSAGGAAAAAEFPEHSPTYWLAMANTMVRRYCTLQAEQATLTAVKKAVEASASRWGECGEVRDKGHFPGRRPLGRDTWSWPEIKLAPQVPAGHWPRQEDPPWCNAGVRCSKQKRSSRSNNTIRWTIVILHDGRPRSADRVKGSVPAEHVQELEHGRLPSQQCHCAAGPH